MEEPFPAELTEETLQKLQDRLRAVAYRQMGDQAEDLVQETLFFFFENLHTGKYRGGSSYPEYFCYALGILKVIIIKEIKKRQQARVRFSGEELDSMGDRLPDLDDPSAEDFLLEIEQNQWNRSTMDMVHVHFQELPPHIQELVYLHIVQDWSYSRLSTHFGVPKQTLVSRFNSAMDRLRRKLPKPHTTQGS